MQQLQECVAILQLIYAVSPYLSPQRSPINSQFPCCPYAISPVSLQRLTNDIRLCSLNGPRGFTPLPEALLRPINKFWWEVSRLNHLALAHHEGVLDNVFELSDIAGKIISHQEAHDLMGDSRKILSRLVVELFDEAFDQKGDIFPSTREGWKINLHYIEAIVKVIPELP